MQESARRQVRSEAPEAGRHPSRKPRHLRRPSPLITGHRHGDNRAGDLIRFLTDGRMAMTRTRDSDVDAKLDAIFHSHWRGATVSIGEYFAFAQDDGTRGSFIMTSNFRMTADDVSYSLGSGCFNFSSVSHEPYVDYGVSLYRLIAVDYTGGDTIRFVEAMGEGGSLRMSMIRRMTPSPPDAPQASS
jgi:hypothetical protein